MKAYDARGAVLGRLAVLVAKDAMLGHEVVIINAGDAILTGTKESIIAKYARKQAMGQHHKGPFLHKTSEKFVKRVIRGMLPHKEVRGALALKRVKCYTGVPEGLTVVPIVMKSSTPHEHLSVRNLLRYLGGSI